jgi:UDPglucose 6-dehydrogenase
MNVAMIGLGKLGLPVALAMQSRGHNVWGYDTSEAATMNAMDAGLPVLYEQPMIGNADIVFVAVQTPHDPMYEGITRVPETRKDFDYTALKGAVQGLAEYLQPGQVLAVISTVLPGTMEREIWPLVPDGVGKVYNPSFIAMGTVQEDFLNPEFVLLGVDEPWAAEMVKLFYGLTVLKGEGWGPPTYCTSVKNAELIKVAYNTAIGMKLSFVNVLLELCENTGCNVDAVTDGLKLATKRIISPMYLTAGMGDGGACHPRDNIALSWLAQETGLRYDFFGAMMMAREKQAEWLADLMCEYNLPKVILGTAYKPGIGMEAGSHALLVKSILEERGHEVFTCDPYANRLLPGRFGVEASVALVGCNHPEFRDYKFPQGTVVLDPWRTMPDQDGVTVRRLGEGRK